MKQRVKRLVSGFMVAVGAGVIYALIISKTGWGGIPCPFHLITGLYCPGCGVTHMCLAIIRLNMKEAFLANPVVFFLLLPGGILAVHISIRYVKTGVVFLTKYQNAVVIGMCVVLILFGIIRNIPTFL